MIWALNQQQGQFRVGKYLGFEEDQASARQFTYEVVSSKERHYNQVVQNLINAEGTTTIKTNFVFEWEIQNRVVLQDGKIYIITDIASEEEEVNPQAFGTMAFGTDTLYYLKLTTAEEFND